MGRTDLDLIIRISEQISIETAKQMIDQLLALPVRVDVQLEGKKGAVSLMEYAKGQYQMLLKTLHGPILVNNVWN